MANVVVVGSQWGDEGKGKIVDWLSEQADIVVRFQGGHNAGHTLVINGTTYKLSLLPSGVVRPGKLSVIGNGVVLDPAAFLHEVESLRRAGVKVDSTNLLVSNRAQVILPYHRMMELASENAPGRVKIGTTSRGIGPTYEDKMGRRGLRVIDMLDQKLLKKHIENACREKNKARGARNPPPERSKFLQQDKQREGRDPKRVHHAADEQKRHQNPAAADAIGAVPETEQQASSDVPAEAAVAQEESER